VGNCVVAATLLQLATGFVGHDEWAIKICGEPGGGRVLINEQCWGGLACIQRSEAGNLGAGPSIERLHLHLHAVLRGAMRRAREGATE
jgi:hypothetical protein